MFAQIAKQLWERRPDIPFLVVEGRCGADWLARTGVDLRGVKNINFMANTPDPRDFYRVSKLVIVPSLFMESFGRMAAESMINGIPVIGSNRGALPEVIGEAGLTLEIPAQYTPESRTAPTPEEVEPWLQAIIKLWDDAEFYETLRQKSLARAERWQQIASPNNTMRVFQNCWDNAISFFSRCFCVCCHPLYSGVFPCVYCQIGENGKSANSGIFQE